MKCSQCNNERRDDEFTIYGKEKFICNKCYHAKKRKSDKGKLAIIRWNEKKAKRLYNLTDEQFELLKLQTTCKICGKLNLSGKDRHIDHDHITGVVRGILCNKCNIMIGMAGDNPSTLISAINYLNRRPS